MDAQPDSAQDAGSDAGDATRPPADVAGEVEIYGCEIDASSIRVRLSALSVTTDEERASILGEEPSADDAATLPVFEADVEAGDEPGSFRFTASELPFDLYRIGVEIDAEGCEELVWRGPSEGLVHAGDVEVAMTAVALRTRLEVLNADSEAWTSGLFVDPDTTELRFRIRTDVPDVVAMDVQMSMERFDVRDPSAGDFCDPPEDAETERMEIPAGGRELSIDVSRFFTEPTDGAPDDVVRWQRVLAGAPLYVRVVPVSSSGIACRIRQDGASSWVRLIRREPAPTVAPIPGPELSMTGTYTAGYYPFQNIITHNHSCYRFITQHRLDGTPPPAFQLPADPMGYLLVAKGIYPNGYLAMPGEQFCLAPSSGGSSSGPFGAIGDAFADFVGSIADAAEWAVNQAAALYEEIKSKVVGLVAHAVAELTGCEAPCRAALELGAELALASMGLPPSLPDFDALVNEGFGYLAAELADQAGVPDFIAEEAIEIAMRFIERANATRGIPFSPYLVRDTGFVSTGVRLDVTRRPGVSARKRLIYIVPQPAGVWHPRTLNLKVPESGTLHIPVSISPDLTGLPPVEPLIPAVGFIPAYYGGPQRIEAWYQTQWGPRIAAHSCVGFLAIGVWLDTDLGPPVQVAERLAAPTLVNAETNAFSAPFEAQCSL